MALVERLLADGADPTATGWSPSLSFGDLLTPLHVLGLRRESPVAAAEALVAAGASVHARSTRRSWTPLHLAAAMNHTSLVRWLLDRGADPNAVAVPYNTPTALIGCIIPKTALCMPTVEALLSAGADPTLAPKGSPKPIHVAVDYRNVDAMRRLAEAGADLDARTGQSVTGNETPLMKAVSRHHTEPVAALLALGATVDGRSAVGQTALHRAALSEHLHHMTTLLDHGATVDARDDHGHTPLTAWLAWAFRATPLAVVDLLLARGADPRVLDASGTPALHLALQKGEADVVKRLVAAGASLDATDAEGRTAADVARSSPALLQVAVGLPPPAAAPPPSRVFLDALAAGCRWSHREAELVQRGDRFVWSGRNAPKGRFTEETVRAHMAWLLLQENGEAEKIAAWLGEVDGQVGRSARGVEALRADLHAREPELARRVQAELKPSHATHIIEAAVREGFVPCRHDKEGFWTWTFLPDAPDNRAFRFHEAGDHNPAGTIEDRSSADLRRFFGRYGQLDGRLTDWRRNDLDGALDRLGYETERQWLVARDRT